jgi:hypothetical protein
MCATTLLSRGLVCFILALGTLPGLPAGPVNPARPTKKRHGPSKTKVRKRVAKMIDGLANRNRPPRLVDFGQGAQLPLFPPKYDWKEFKRVLSALAKVSEERTPEMWEELVQRIDDRRYCLTLKDNSDIYALGHWTVGDFCVTFARNWLLGVCNQHLPSDPKKDGFPINLRIRPTGSWAKWRKERADKQLYELQIEVCEETIRQLAKAAGVPQRDKNRARKKIEAEVATLRRTKRPIFTDYTIDYIGAYTAKEAEEARELLQKDRKKRQHHH